MWYYRKNIERKKPTTNICLRLHVILDVRTDRGRSQIRWVVAKILLENFGYMEMEWNFVHGIEQVKEMKDWNLEKIRIIRALLASPTFTGGQKMHKEREVNAITRNIKLDRINILSSFNTFK